MNIQNAKTQIANTLRAYLAKDETGNYRIPPMRQRPVFLIGPPGIGKTQIMEQIASEEGVGLVAYTITHHTRQSAVGLPFIEKRMFDGREYTVTEYTMSEILTSVHMLMEKTGIREGILFLDEINCVSETLAPMMLQFLQYKTFGNQRLPEGWLIVAAGNPPEYNRSVRDFDVVTLDRMKVIPVEEDYGVWKDYALRRNIHGAILSYLDLKRDNFYRMETSADGPQFVTARGWEDLSDLIRTYEKLGISVDADVTMQYIRLPEIARDFANYLSLYRKYHEIYHVEELLSGRWPAIAESQFRSAAFDERLSVIGLLSSALSEKAGAVHRQDDITACLHENLQAWKASLGSSSPGEELDKLLSSLRQALNRAKEAGQGTSKRDKPQRAAIIALEALRESLRDTLTPQQALDAARQMLARESEKTDSLAEDCSRTFENAFRFLEHAVGDSQEMVLFVTNLTAGPDTSWFVENFGCESYFRHNKELLADETRRSILRDIANAT